jgi:UDPglucose 6-dehydrogenase
MDAATGQGEHMDLTVIGAGYVGLVAGACFSGAGNRVTIVDVNADRVAALGRGEVPIYEPGLDEVIAENIEAGRLSFTTDASDAVAASEVVILAVGTPSAPDGSVDMSAMEAAADQVGEAMAGYTVVLTKSTVPVGTHRRLCERMAARTDEAFDYVANPEFLKEGSAVDDFLKPDRVIVGVDSDRALQVVRHLYAPFMRRQDRMIVMDPASAELAKYACNAMLAARVTFMNEMARLCERVGADIENVRLAMGADHRIGRDFLFASLGFGGSCFPKDVRALISTARTANQPLRIVEAMDLANQAQREVLFDRVRHYFGGRLHERTFAVWGLAFKARTDDVRESPALTVVQRLIGAGARVAAHDPQAMDTARAVLGPNHVRYVEDMYEALDGADGLIVCTEWQAYRTPDFRSIQARLAEPVIFDGRNLYDLDWMARTGLTYISIGRPVVKPAEGG